MFWILENPTIFVSVIILSQYNSQQCMYIPIAILLAHLKLPPSQIKKALLAMDTMVLSEQHLQQMETFAPDKKEV